MVARKGKGAMGSPTVRSFDLFDTLLGRLHYRPESTFELVEKHFPFPGFTLYRMLAEYKSNGTLADIYRHFQELTGVSEEQAAALLRCEYEMELSQIFPIVENCNRVQVEDLIVSDTYYNREQIQGILNKIGITHPVYIYASSGGKSSGRIWDILAKEHRISSHLGDSLHSDVVMAKAKGIAATHYEGSQMSPHEQAMVKMGQPELACLMRALRLQNPYVPDSPEYLLWNDQCQINIPLLLHACLYLHDFCEKHQKKRILFTARDGCLWIQLFRQLYPEYDAHYFHSSRYTYRFPSPSYIEYVRSLYTHDTVIVDSHGKGYSFAVFFKKHFHIEPTYLAIVNLKRKHHGILRSRKVYVVIEMINYDVVGALYDVVDGKPMRSEPEYNVRYIWPSHHCIKKCIEILPSFSIKKFDQKVMKWAVKKIDAGLTLQKYVDHARHHTHIAQEDSSLRHLHVMDDGFLYEPKA